MCQHSALDHDYLCFLSSRDLPNIKEAVKDYAHQYSFYSSHFVDYLDGVISSVTENHHQEALWCNMREERGNPNAIVYPVSSS